MIAQPSVPCSRTRGVNGRGSWPARGLLLLLAALGAGQRLPAEGPLVLIEPETFRSPPVPLWPDVDEQVLALAFAPDGKTLVTAGARHTQPGQLKVWDVATGRELASVRGIRGTRTVAFSPDGQVLACGEFGGAIRLRDAHTGQERAVLTGHTVGVNSLAFSTDGASLVSAGLDRAVKLWDVKELQERQVFLGHTGMVFSVALFHHRPAMVTGGGDRTARVWDLRSGLEKFTLSGHQAAVEAVAVAPDDSRLATASWDGTVKLWDPETGKETAVLEGKDAVLAVAFSPDGKLLATSTSSGAVRLWDVATHQPP